MTKTKEDKRPAAANEPRHRTFESTGFKNRNSELEAYLESPVAPTGRGLKAPNVAAARSAASEFAETAGAKRHRDHFLVCLEGAGVHPTVSLNLANESKINADV